MVERFKTVTFDGKKSVVVMNSNHAQYTNICIPIRTYTINTNRLSYEPKKMPLSRLCQCY